MTPAFAFATAQTIRFGRGEAARAVPDILAMGKRILLVTGANTSRADWLHAALTAEGATVTVNPTDGEPDIAQISAGVALARDAGAQVVVALGGGAAIDAGKAIAALTPAHRPMMDHLEVVGKGLPLDVPPLKFVALPSTAGTGAEVTKNAVISVPEAQRKVSLRDNRMLPHLAIIDPSLTDHCPRAVTLASGLDAITQVIEPYLCTRANPLTDALCADAIPRGLKALRTLMAGEDPDARDSMAWVSLCGGIALANAGLGVIHGLAGPLGGLSGANHGAICGALLPHGLAMNAARGADPDRIGRIDQWITDALGDTPLHDWSRAAGLPGLTAQGITEQHRNEAAEMAATSSSMKANPVPLTPDDLRQIMRDAQ
ncbi:iron-containing alcohol dehydrogenase [Tropicibacter alexandrii]|uniref:iron-containing alcohol dehydrogenase n=1 Tax=Tropicibacter alexandrii TaxID=2267683 RepID=UPI000EF4713B|nr:iron-containing alcohol dehydrogenase [Tropicibacter alexandrii]